MRETHVDLQSQDGTDEVDDVPKPSLELRITPNHEYITSLDYVHPAPHCYLSAAIRFWRCYTIGEIHAMLMEYEKSLPKKAETPQVMMIKKGKIQKVNKKSLKVKGKVIGKGKDKKVYVPKPANPKPIAKERPAKDDACHHCKEVGHCKRNCPVYLAELLKKKKQVGGASSSDNCHYAPSIMRGVVSVSRLVDNGFVQKFTDYGISISKNNVLYFNVVARNGVYEMICYSCTKTNNSIYNVSNKRVKRNLDSTYLWHCRLAHINKKRIKQLQQDGLLKSTDDESFDQCESCLQHAFQLVPTKKALVSEIRPDRSRTRSVKCIFIGYPKETMGYYFYFPPENKIVVARYAEFFEKRLINQEISGRAVDLEEIQEQEDTSPSEITSNIPQEVEGFGPPPQEEEIPIRRSERTRRVPNRLCLNVEVEEHSLGDLNEPTSYKAAMLDAESNKWIDAMNAEIQSMMDNKVWVLVDLPPGCKTVGSKWLFKKKTDMDGIVHVYKARLVAKGYTQLYGVDYEEKFSPVADIRAIRILISIAAYYDYEVLLILIIPEKYASLRDLFMVLSKHQEAGIKDLMRKSKVGSIMYAVRCTRPDVAFTKNITRGFKNQAKARYLEVDCYCDAGFETDRDDTKSQTGYVFVLNGGAVDWKSSKQSTIAMSATESEYIAASEAAMEAVWIRKFISGLGIVPTINEPINMYCDNSAAVHYANEPGVQRGARHYLRKYHYVRESVALGEIKILKVHTDNNLADPFTKALSNRKLTQHARSMGLHPASSFM
ncbi:retrotransposon protein, putative, ty1-copia subclass [Tanacetum coccineum]